MAKRQTVGMSIIISAIISLVTFLYKCIIGVITASNILIVASMSVLLVFLCKMIFIKDLYQSRATKKRAYFFMALLAAAYGVLFLLFAVFKIGGINTAKQNTFSGWVGYLFIGFVILTFILSLINLTGALHREDIIFIGLKEMIFVSALADAVIIEEFLYKIILFNQNIPYMYYVDLYFPLGVGVLMLLIPVFMFIRFAKYVA